MLRPENSTVDEQTRNFLSMVNQTEHYIEDMEKGMFAYLRKSSRTRDKLDALANTILQPICAKTEGLLSWEKALKDFACELTHLADLRDWESAEVEDLLQGDLGQYDQFCKAVREEVKINASIRNKENLRRMAAELKRSSSTIMRADQDFEKIVEDFEQQKSTDLQKFLTTFIKIQLKVHLDSVNHLSSLYRKVQDIDSAADAVQCRERILQATDVTKPDKLAKSRSQSMGALNNLMLHSNPFRRIAAPSEPQIQVIKCEDSRQAFPHSKEDCAEDVTSDEAERS